MPSCKETARLVSESMDRKLPLWQRMILSLHLMMCTYCASFKRQLQIIRRASRYNDDNREHESAGSVRMPEDARRKLKKTLQDRLS